MGDGLLLFESNMKQGTNDAEMIQTVIDKLEDWDGIMDYNENKVSRIMSSTDQKELFELFNYFNDLPISTIGVHDNHGKIIHIKKVNFIIRYSTSVLKAIPYDFKLVEKVERNYFIEEVSEKL